ncbi:MAG: hypothetical protein WC470_02100 [Candidatus Paceibacterota bacterium]
MILKSAQRRNNIFESLTKGVPVDTRKTKAQQRELNRKIADRGNLSQKGFNELYG